MNVAGPAPGTPSRPKPHICICICTCQRPELLRRLLEAVSRLELAGLVSRLPGGEIGRVALDEAVL